MLQVHNLKECGPLESFRKKVDDLARSVYALSCAKIFLIDRTTARIVLIPRAELEPRLFREPYTIEDLLKLRDHLASTMFAFYQAVTNPLVEREISFPVIPPHLVSDPEVLDALPHQIALTQESYRTGLRVYAVDDQGAHNSSKSAIGAVAKKFEIVTRAYINGGADAVIPLAALAKESSPLKIPDSAEVSVPKEAEKSIFISGKISSVDKAASWIILDGRSIIEYPGIKEMPDIKVGDLQANVEVLLRHSFGGKRLYMAHFR